MTNNVRLAISIADTTQVILCKLIRIGDTKLYLV